MGNVRRIVMTAALASAWMPGLALAWWNDDWNFRKVLTVDTTPAAANLGQGLQDVPVLIRLHVGNFGYFADTKPDGSDLRFIAADDKTPLPFHIESFDPGAGMAFIWVRLPAVRAASSDKIYLYYGNPQATSAADSKATYDVKQVVAYHFDVSPPADGTSYGNNPADATQIENASAVIGAGARFGGAQRITIPASPSLRLVPVEGMTVSTWIAIDGEQQDAVVVQASDPDGARVTLAIDALAPYLEIVSGAAAARATSSVALTVGKWHLLAATIAADKSTLYLDGQPVGEIAAVASPINGPFGIGGVVDGQRFLTGHLDELGVATTVRSPEWLRLQFANQGQTDALLVYGEDASRESGEQPSYFLVTLRNVTVDGWVVIGVLALMSIVSWVIMVTKGLTIARIRKDNGAFLADFRRKTMGNVASLDDPTQDEDDAEPAFASAIAGPHDHYQSSSLYHLYHLGLAEVRRRTEGVALGAARSHQLSRESMDAIRAALDGANVRETQKLNGQMVLLTLAIAGGPFLGLLGTVVGVMITFAAIAASGDVNVNAIAPGIAAALAATVAGLAVAIPALFGYNYLASRIKEIVADDRVFIDEFTTRLAEQYS
jgi:biopolymer transport protein ExbB